jgi:hypothetical protein
LSNRPEQGSVGFRPFPPEGGETPRAFFFSVEGSSPWWTELVKNGALCRYGDHGDYECFGGRAPTQGLEELEFGIREPYYYERVGLWLRPVVPGPKQRSFLETRWSRRLPGTEMPPGREAGSTRNGQMAEFCLL